MTVLQALLGFAVVAGVLTLIPGLDSTLVLRSALTRGRRTASVTGLGILTGSLTWGAAAAVGASAILAVSELAYRLLTLAGAAYLLYLGVSLVVRTFRRLPETEGAAAAPTSLRRAYATGLLTNLANPKVGVFYLATIPQFIPHGAVPVLMGLALAGVHCVLTIIWFAALIAAAGLFSRFLRTPRVERIIDRVTGLVLVGFGVKVVLDPS